MKIFKQHKYSYTVAFVIFLTVSLFLEQQVVAQTTVKLAHIWSAESLQHKTHQLFSEILAKQTNNQVKVKVFPAGQLGGWKDILEGEKTGMAHGIFISADTLGFSSQTATRGLWPYLFDSKEEFKRAYNSEVGREYLNELRKLTGYEVMAPSYKGARHMFCRKPIHSMKDLKGIKIRTPGFDVTMETWRLLGANPVPMGALEAFTALQQGVIDAVEQELQGGYDLGYHEAAPNIILTRHAMEDFSWIFWAEWIEKFPTETQAAIRKAASESAAWFENELIKIEEDMIEKLKAAKCTIISPDLAEFKASLKPIKERVPDLWPWAQKLKAAGESK